MNHEYGPLNKCNCYVPRKHSMFLTLLIIVLIAFTYTFLAYPSNIYTVQGDEILGLINGAMDELNSGNTEGALAKLTEAKGLLAYLTASLTSGESEAIIGKLGFSLIEADEAAWYNFMGDYHSFKVYMKVANLDVDIVEVEGSLWGDYIESVEIDGYAISPVGNQIEGSPELYQFDRILPGVNKVVGIKFTIGFESTQKFVPGEYSIIIRLKPQGEEARFIQKQFTIKEDR